MRFSHAHQLFLIEHPNSVPPACLDPSNNRMSYGNFFDDVFSPVSYATVKVQVFVKHSAAKFRTQMPHVHREKQLLCVYTHNVIGLASGSANSANAKLKHCLLPRKLEEERRQS